MGTGLGGDDGGRQKEQHEERHEASHTGVPCADEQIICRVRFELATRPKVELGGGGGRDRLSLIPVSVGLPGRNSLPLPLSSKPRSVPGFTGVTLWKPA